MQKFYRKSQLIQTVFGQTWARRLVLSVVQQAGAAQLCLDVESAALLPGSHEVQNMRVRTQALMIPGFPDAPIPLTVTPEALSRAFDCVLTTISVALHLEREKKISRNYNF